MGKPRDGGILFKTCDDSSYKSLDAHRSESGTRHQKSIWNDDLSRNDECHTFCEANIEQWHDKDGNCWSVVTGKTVYFGTRKEWVAFFWMPQNDVDPWHGFPVSRTGKVPFLRKLPDELVERWRQNSRIDFTMQLRLLQGRW